MMKERLEEQYAWRKEQLEREVAALQQHRAAVVAQLQNLKELATEAGKDFPGTDPFGSVEPAEGGSAAEQGDAEKTMIRPASQPAGSDEPTTVLD
jgi:ribosomal protein L9